jgi:hypothetical protein
VKYVECYSTFDFDTRMLVNTYFKMVLVY